MIEKGVEIMSKRTILNKRIAHVSTVMLVTVATVIFLMSMATQVTAEQSRAYLKGEVVAVDYNARTVTVSSNEKVAFTFAMDKGTYVTSCTQNMIFRDIGVGEKVAVTYHDAGDSLVADIIDITPASIAYACLDE